MLIGNNRQSLFTSIVTPDMTSIAYVMKYCERNVEVAIQTFFIQRLPSSSVRAFEPVISFSVNLLNTAVFSLKTSPTKKKIFHSVV